MSFSTSTQPSTQSERLTNSYVNQGINSSCEYDSVEKRKTDKKTKVKSDFFIMNKFKLIVVQSKQNNKDVVVKPDSNLLGVWLAGKSLYRKFYCVYPDKNSGYHIFVLLKIV